WRLLPACHAMSSPAVTKPTLLKVLAGCRTAQPRPPSQKGPPRPTSAPSQPRQIATARRPHETIAVAPATATGLRSRSTPVTLLTAEALGEVAQVSDGKRVRRTRGA